MSALVSKRFFKFFSKQFQFSEGGTTPVTRSAEATRRLATEPVPGPREFDDTRVALILSLCHRCLTKMDTGHRAIFVWTLLLFVLIFLVVYLDGGLDQETLIFFSLLWFFDFLSLAELVAGMIRHYRLLHGDVDRFPNNRFHTPFNARKTAISTMLLLLKTIFELCLYWHLKYTDFKLVWVMIPFWLFLLIIIAQLSVYIVQIHQKSVSEESR